MTGGLSVRGLVRRFPGTGTTALDDVSLELPDGAHTVILGPSGSGKTTLLRVLAGLDRAQAGDVVLDGRSLRDVPPSRRPTAMVFQSDTVFPEMTVRENVGFGLRARRVPARRAAELVDVALLQTGLAGLDDRLPAELSGGQRRRVVLARALVVRPRILLLDEPGAGLDETLRARVLREVRAVQRRLGLTVLHVTHDHQTALAVADHLVVLRDGRVEQVGPPRAVYERPASAFVAGFVGRSNFLECTVLSVDGPAGRRRATVRVLGGTVEVSAHDAVTASGAATLLVRPHGLRVARVDPQPRKPDARGAVGLVQEVLFRGESIEYEVETESGSVLAVGSLDEPSCEENTLVTLQLDADRAWLLPVGDATPVS